MSSTPTLTRGDRAMLAIFAAIATTIGLITLVAGVLRTRLYLGATADGGTPVALLTDAPVPGVPTTSDPQIVFGAFPSADLLVTGLSTTTRALLATGEGVGTLVTVVVAAAVGWLFLTLARGRPFARPLSTLALVAGSTLALGSLLGQALAGFGRMNAADELNPVTNDLFRVGFAFDPAPIVIGFAIMALSYVFRAGTRLERDTAGLV